MKQFIVALFFLPQLAFSQLQYQGSELGLEPYIGFSNVGGALGGEVKYAARLSENLLVGPSFRVQRIWSNNLGIQSQMTTWGGGAFAHLRYQEKNWRALLHQMSSALGTKQHTLIQYSGPGLPVKALRLKLLTHELTRRWQKAQKALTNC